MTGSVTDACRRMFSVLHHRSEPVAAFSDIPHWISPARALVAEAGAYERERVYVPAGCFYALSTPPPSDEELIAARKQASDLGVAGILYRACAPPPIGVPWSGLGFGRSHGSSKAFLRSWKASKRIYGTSGWRAFS